MRLKSHTLIPPGGWYYIQPETEFRIEADDFYTLVSRTIQHRKYKNIHPYDPTSALIEVERQICKRIGNHPEYIANA